MVKVLLELKKKKNKSSYTVTKIQVIIEKILPHFVNYPLITQKKHDFLFWKEIILKLSAKEHLTKEGLQSIVNLKASLNLGLSQSLKEAFPSSKPVFRPTNDSIVKFNPFWIAGFTSAEGCFSVNMHKSTSLKLKERVKLIFRISQHSRDEALIRSFITYFNCGSAIKNRESFEFIVQDLPNITNKLIPFFTQHSIKGVKFFDYLDWCKVAKLMDQKAHLTSEGLEQIRKLKEGMNTGRKI